MNNTNICEEKAPKPKKHILSKILCPALIFIASLLFFSALWYIKTYGGIGFDSILFTLFSNMGGVESDILVSFTLKAVLPAVALSLVLGFTLFFKNENRKFLKIKNIYSVICSSLVVVILLVSAGQMADLFAYLYKLTHQTKIYEEKYVEPDSVSISFPEEKRNLIYIFLESIETSFMPKEKGGALENNIMPELISLAEENINFSNNDGVGGFLTPSGTTWTVSAMVAQTAGVPLKASSGELNNNEYGKECFLPGVTTLMDILGDVGYNQAIMMGSKASFAHRDVYYDSHGINKIYDLFQARSDGIVPKNYYVWWGMEDKYLFSYAKDKLSQMAEEGEPFAFSLLTADTHFEAGYVCDLCKSEFGEQYDNVIACSSRQIAEFVDWIKAQDFYDNTTIVIAGDHLTMDNGYRERNIDKEYPRRVYNCIINPAASTDNYKNRVFTSFDLFPTTLAAMGCGIEGERLGLGTNLFSDAKTLAEEMGYGKFNNEISMSSTYYIKNFLIEK